MWRSPLVPIALASSAGVVFDRYLGIPLGFSLLAAVICLVAWTLALLGKGGVYAPLYLWLAALALGSSYHHWFRTIFAGDDIGNYASEDARLMRVRGVLDEEPTIAWQPPADPLQSFSHGDSTSSVLRAKEALLNDHWTRLSGKARLVVAGHMTGLHVGDEIEVVGRVQCPASAMNPGEFDYRAYLLDQRIRAVIAVRKTPDGIMRLAVGWPRSVLGWLAIVHGWAQRTIMEAIPEPEGGVATALLLGEGSTMTNADWDKYIRTGVIHVLAISGQHLVVLGGFIWLVLRVVGVRRRRSALFVAVFLLAYALLAGGRPPVMRSAVMVCAACGGMMLRRPVLTANSFALSWLIVMLLNPADLFGAGCQLSFLAVAILYWGVSRIPRSDRDPLKQLIEESRPNWQRWLRAFGRHILMAYAVTLIIWLAAAPLVADRYHLISPVGLLIGPPVVFLTSVALLAGFLLLLLWPFCRPLAVPFATLTKWSLAGCESIVRIADNLPGAHWYLADIPEWWLWTFYVSLFGILWLECLRTQWRWTVPAGAAWLCVGLLAGSARPTANELRCTFLAVGHGGCTVIETPDRRTILYDAGALGGPDVTRRQIAPFLWQRGIRRIDEVILSHADLDHFNGLPELFKRFAVGQVTMTPSFAIKEIEAVRVFMNELKQRGIPVRIVQAGDRLSAGPVEMEVLHPPAKGPPGNENARSLVLLLEHEGHTLLLTGDLEGAGLERVLSLPPQRVDILMAPHHGSLAANKKELAEWANPHVVIACQGPPRWPSRKTEPYTERGMRYLGTWPHGAITIHSAAGQLNVETYKTGERYVFE
ncbi:MAG: DNA internalization-related competence protein ComEC/Rec2 [Gemmataceae bacterium]